MAFVVEDGTGLPDANSYASVAEADAYHADRGNTAWAGIEVVKESALVRATDYIEQVYSGRWKGARLTDNQALEWPRTAAEGIPSHIKQAVFQLALEGVSGANLNPTLGRAIKRRKVDVIETEYMDNAKAGNTRPAIDGLLRAYLVGVGINGKAIRV